MQLRLDFDYRSCIQNSERVAWTLDEVFPEGTSLNFTKRFLPHELAPTSHITCLSATEKLWLNQIAANAYLNLFGFVEEYILAVVVQHASAEMFGDHDAIRALLRFGEEEVKHQHLFERYRVAFNRDFGVDCGVLGSADKVAGVVMSKSPIAVMILTLHIELFTQQHYTESVRDDADLDPLMRSMLRHHWLDESQHARIDALELQKLLEDATPELVHRGIDEFLELGNAIAGLLLEQAKMDVVSLAQKAKRTFTAAESDAVQAAQYKGYLKTFLWYGMTNPMFVSILEQVDKEGAAKIATVAKGLG